LPKRRLASSSHPEVEIIKNLKRGTKPVPYPVVALGNFDGLHRGHQALIRSVVERARTRNGTSVLLTFEPHPLKILAPHLDLKLLSTFDEKIGLLEEMGVDRVVCVPFTPAFASQSPEEFAHDLLHLHLQVKEVFVGDDFAFGKNRTGTVKDLKRLGSRLGFEVHSIGAVTVEGEVVSSSRIRELLTAGRAKEAARLLGRVYSLEGKVIPGSRRGMALGFPTANLKPPDDRVVPADGVYAAWGVLQDQIKPGVAYIGTQPTLGPSERTVELHLFESHPDLYHKTIRVGFWDFIRDEKVFPNQNQLIRQIVQDVDAAKGLLRPKPRGGMLILDE
jgi:riboflavin kinase/FMN adenylyltransferase